MKYGQSLGAFSVPEWRSHNILYDELKHEIKELTVTSAAFSKSGYQQLVESFKEEYASVNLFVHCTLSEVEYRFQQCDRLVHSIVKLTPPSHASKPSFSIGSPQAENDGDNDTDGEGSDLSSRPKHTRTSSFFVGGNNQDKRPRAFSTKSRTFSMKSLPPQVAADVELMIAELSSEITKLRHEIQKLSRFLGAQTTGFRKLIKKYRRHAPKEQLKKGRDLGEIGDILVSKDSFAEIDLTPQFLELSLLYSIVRTKKFSDYVKKPRRGTSMVDQLATYDTEMLTAPGASVSRFWVHSDNLMQLKMLLLEQLDLAAPQREADRAHTKESTKAVYMDNADLQSARNLKEPAQVRQIAFGRELSDPFLLVPMTGGRHPASARLTTDQVRMLFEERYGELKMSQADANADSRAQSEASEAPETTPGEIGAGGNNNNNSSSSNNNNDIEDEDENSSSDGRSVGAQLALGWVSSQRAKPVVSLSMRRTRFLSPGDRIWASVDTMATIEDEETAQTEIVDPMVGQASPDQTSETTPIKAASGKELLVFPYSVLEIRSRTPYPWIDALQRSHLVYPVSASFSLYGWALLATRPQQVLVRPSWLDVLDDKVDIRREPSKGVDPLKTSKSFANLKITGPRSPERSNGFANYGLKSSGATNGEAKGSTTGSAVDPNSLHIPSQPNAIDSEELSPRATPRRRSSAQARHSDTARARDQEAGAEEERPPPSMRYWNEFDDGDEFQESNDQFFDELDEELCRARVASKLARPVYQIGEGMRRKFSLIFDHSNSTSTSEPDSSADSIRSVESGVSSSTGTHAGSATSHDGHVAGHTHARQFSPRLVSHHRTSHGPNYGSCESNDFEAELEYVRRRNDRALSLIISLCFAISLGIVTLVYVILLTEDVQLLPGGLRSSLILFLAVAVLLALLSYVAYNFRSDTGWGSQVAVHVALLVVVCFGAGGVANLILP